MLINGQGRVGFKENSRTIDTWVGEGSEADRVGGEGLEGGEGERD